MKRRILISLLIVAQAYYFIGCSVYSSIQIVDINQIKEDNKVHSAKLLSGEVLIFGQKPGEIKTVTRVLTGRTIEGTSVIIPVTEVKQIFSGINAVPLDSKELSSDSTLRISHLVLAEGEILKFDSSGARFRSKVHVLNGVSTDGKNIMIPVEELLQLDAEQQNSGLSLLATWGMILGIGTVFLAVVFLLIGEGPSWTTSKKPYSFH